MRIVLHADGPFSARRFAICPTFDCPGDDASLILWRHDDICDVRNPLFITRVVSGTVTVDEIDLTTGGRVRGSFQVQDSDGAEIAGTFNSIFCTQPTLSESCTE